MIFNAGDTAYIIENGIRVKPVKILSRRKCFCHYRGGERQRRVLEKERIFRYFLLKYSFLCENSV